MSSEIKSVIIYSRVNREKVAFTIVDLVNFISDLGINVLIEKSTNDKLHMDLPTLTFDEMTGKADLMIVVGGDGSMIGAAREIVPTRIPVLGINRGHLGFLTDLAPQDINKSLLKVLKGGYILEERFLLSASVFGPDCQQHSLALNEVVIHGVKTAHMIDFSIFVNNNKFMYSQKADGLIVSTPTGSTAYNLSAGGPVIEPSLNVISLVPMFPHSMNLRPIILNGDSEIKICFSNKLNPEDIAISCDGQITLSANDHCEIHIKKHSSPIKICHPYSYDYFKVLRSKLSFGSKLVD